MADSSHSRLTMSRQTRRHFLQQAVGAVSAVTILTHVARCDVNSRIRVATVGLNGRGKDHIAGLHDNLVALCDCDLRILGSAADNFQKSYRRKLDQIVDFRRLLDRHDIDAISIATPNHTHSLIAILAPQSGKDVYVEKPISHCLWEGRQQVRAAESTGRIVQSGTQSRTQPAIQQAVEAVHSGKFGKIQHIIGTCYKPRMAIGKQIVPLAIPKELDYDLWCGPVTKVDIHRPERNSLGGYNPHYDWHWDYHTGNGDMGNQGIHQMDIARWFLGAKTVSPRILSFGGRFGYDDAGNSANTQIVLHDYPEAPIVFETRGLPSSKAAQKDAKTWGASMDQYHGAKVGVIVKCEEATIVSTSKYDEVKAFGPDGKVTATWRGSGDHLPIFLAPSARESRAIFMLPSLKGTCRVPYAIPGIFRTNWANAIQPKTCSEQLGATSSCLIRSSVCWPICGRMPWT
jgi:predicted dehydrogenase